MKDRRSLALFIDDDLADDTDHMMKKHVGDIYASDATFPPFEMSDLEGITNFFIFEPSEDDLSILLNQKSKNI